MLRTLVRKEILESLLSFKFLVATVLCLTLIPLGTYVNLKEYEQRLGDYQEALRIYQERSEGNLDLGFQALGYRPPSMLSVFSVGLENVLPNKVATSKDGNVRMSNEQGINNPQSLLFGKVDLLFNVSYVISLLALLLTFSTISGEKEDGTLKLVMSNPVARWMVLIAKIIGNYVVLLIPFFLSIAVSLMILETSGLVHFFSSSILSTLLVIVFTTLLFIFAMLNLGVLISSLSHRSITSIVILFLCWTLLVLSVPRISPMVAEILFPVKSQQVINIQKSLLREDLGKAMDGELGDLYASLALRNGLDPNRIFTQGRTDSENKLLSDYDSSKTVIEHRYEQRIALEVKKLDEDYESARRVQSLVAMNLSRLSPVSCYTYVMAEISFTGPLEAENFRENATRYQDEVKENLYDKYILKKYISKSGSANSISYAAGFNPQKAQVPNMNYRRVGLSEALDREWVDIVAILLYNLVFFLASYVSFLKYDLR